MTSFVRPTRNQIETAVQRMKSPEFAAYFLARLQNPHWVEPLRDKGIFANPPPPILMEANQVGHPYWPASDYLTRMAEQVPAKVAEIFADLKTENVRVLSNIVAAALVMPAKNAAALVPVISRAAHEGILSWIHFKDAGALCAHLAKGGLYDDAFTLADAVFAPEFEPGEEEPKRHDEHSYSIALRKTITVLAVRTPDAFLSRLCEWLNMAVAAKRFTNTESGRDYSHLWRPAVEEHDQNLRHGFAGAMVGLVRLGFETAIQNGGLTVKNAIEILARYRYLVFDRIKIHLINEFAQQEPELARATMLERRMFDDSQSKHEYARLVGQRLDLLTKAEQAKWFAFVEEGPNMADFNESHATAKGRDPTDTERQVRKEFWQFQKLHCVRRHLDGERLDFYETMLGRHGEPDLADFSTYVSAGWGNSSPMKVDDLAALTFEQAVEKVASWQPEEHRVTGPDVKGLADTFNEFVATNPEAFSREAGVLIGRPAIYVRIYITRMAEAIKADLKVDVPRQLSLCRWVLTRPVEERTTPEKVGPLVDRDWQWTRSAIADLAKCVCRAKKADAPKYPLELRDAIWEIVDKLLRDDAESQIVHDTSPDDPRMADYLTLAINSPRGNALEAGFEYARWVANHITAASGDQKVIPGGFAEMPEVRTMLEWQIDTVNRTREALAMIGSRLALIYWIDHEWLGQNAERLFDLPSPDMSPPSAEEWSAWNAFLIWVRPHVEFYRLFKAQFASAVEHSTRITIADQSRDNPMNHLGEHLVLLYAWGDLDLNDQDGPLMRFLTGAHPSIRRYAIEFGGRVLQDTEQLPREMVDRLMKLWDVYWGGEGKSDLRDKPDAWLFGIWFSSGKLPERWAMERLEEFVAVTPNPEPDHAIAEQLAKITSIDVARAVRILDRMVRGDTEGWRIHGWLDPARRILDAAMASAGARHQAESTIDYLGRRGHTSFGKLLAHKHITD